MNHPFPAPDRESPPPAASLPPPAMLPRAAAAAATFFRAFILLLLTVIVAHSEEPAAPPPDYAGIYPTNANAPSLGLLESLAPGARIVGSKEGEVAVFTCIWPDVAVKILVDPHWDQRAQIKEMKRLIDTLAGKQKDNPVIEALKKKLDTTTNCFGCVITPRFDPEDKAVSLLLALTSHCEGLIYAHHTFYDAAGNRLQGVEGDPARLQYTK